MESKKVYTITLEGCDDSTVFDMELTHLEFLIINEVATKANETSTYCCEPRMYIVEKEVNENECQTKS